MDTDDFEPREQKHVTLPRLEEMSSEDLEGYIAELESTVNQVRDAIRSEESASSTAYSVFKS
jgi:hypothetical protein